MSKDEKQPSKFQKFITANGTYPAKKPNLFFSFVQGAIVSVVLSLLFFKSESRIEMAVWAVVIGTAWLLSDIWLWNMCKKFKEQEGNTKESNNG